MTYMPCIKVNEQIYEKDNYRKNQAKFLKFAKNEIVMFEMKFKK
jgi:hypothetical protein